MFERRQDNSYPSFVLISFQCVFCVQCIFCRTTTTTTSTSTTATTSTSTTTTTTTTQYVASKCSNGEEEVQACGVFESLKRDRCGEARVVTLCPVMCNACPEATTNATSQPCVKHVLAYFGTPLVGFLAGSILSRSPQQSAELQRASLEGCATSCTELPHCAGFHWSQRYTKCGLKNAGSDAGLSVGKPWQTTYTFYNRLPGDGAEACTDSPTLVPATSAATSTTACPYLTLFAEPLVGVLPDWWLFYLNQDPTVRTTEDCAAACIGNPKCVAFQWSDSKQVCGGKSKRSAEQSAMHTKTRFQQDTLFYNKNTEGRSCDAAGGECSDTAMAAWFDAPLSGFYSGEVVAYFDDDKAVQTAEACAAECLKNAECQALQWHTLDRSCGLKRAQRAENLLKSSRLWHVTYTVYNKLDHPKRRC